jgi:glycosyltransferase involved in cell wall biosynthesis
MALRISHISLHQQGGGAAIAALRIHRALLAHGEKLGVDSCLRVRYGDGSDPSIQAGPPLGNNPLWLRLQPRLTTLARRGFMPAYPITHSIAWPSTGLGRELSRSGRDLIHLHWLGDQMLSIEEVGSLPQPLVWTLHDQWAFCGAEHYDYINQAPPPRYSQGYFASNRPAGERGPDLCRQTWERKRRSWRRPFTIVCPSEWLASCVRSSTLMVQWPVAVIPHPIDTDLWRPIGRLHARAALGLPSEGPIVAFGAMGGTQVPHKGGDLLLQALNWLSKSGDAPSLGRLRLVVFGQAAPDPPLALPLPVHYYGILHDPISMRLLYSAADVVVVPSRIEAFGQVALEAQACGTAVAAFATGGLLDIVADRTSGALAEPFDSRSLAEAIRWVVEDPDRAARLGEVGRRRVEKLYDPAIVACQYAALYQSLVRP